MKFSPACWLSNVSLCTSAVGVQSTDEGYRAGDMALLGFVMAALLVLCLIVIGYLISRVKKGNQDAFKLSEVSIFSSKLSESSSECPLCKRTEA